MNQKGVIHFLLLLILLAGLLTGVYLVTSGNPLKLFSKAANPPIVFKSLDGKSLPVNANGVPRTNSPNFMVELSSTLGPPATVSSSLLTPGLVFAEEQGSTAGYSLGVLVLKYFPLTSNGQNIDISVTGDTGEPYDVIKKRTEEVTNQLKISLEKASSYLGYKNPNAQPALRYTIVDTKEYKQAVPIKAKPGRPTVPDYNGILSSQNICDYVNNKNVKEIWLWAYQGPNKPGDNQPYLGISESKMSGPFGDISNSFRDNDMPSCGKTYRVYTFNYGRYTAEALESWGHQIESEMDAVDRNLYRDRFQGPNYPQTLGVNGRCGSVHNPPNARFEYDRGNPTPQKSDCLDWNSDSMGTLSDISCQNWGCSNDDPIANNFALNYQIWLLQNMPGRDNTKTYQGKQFRNWWDVHGDFDNVMANSRTLFASPSPSPSVTPSPSPTPVLTPTPTPATGTVSYKIAADPTDLDKISYVPYKTDPTVLVYTLKDQHPGIKFIWVEFKDTSGKTDRRSAQIELVSTSPTPTPTPIPTPTSFPSLQAPEMVYPQNGQTLDLEGAYMFKVRPVVGASRYLFGFFQNGVMIFENQRDVKTLSSNGEFAIWESDPAHAKFRAGEVKVTVRALVNNRWTGTREITIILKPRGGDRVPTPISEVPTQIPSPKPETSTAFQLQQRSSQNIRRIVLPIPVIEASPSPQSNVTVQPASNIPILGGLLNYFAEMMIRTLNLWK